MFLTLTHIRKTFGSLIALDDVSLAVERGEFICFLGPSGCGKTTLLRIIAGLEMADSGKIQLADTDLASLPARQRNFGLVFQSYSLFPNMTVARNIAYGLECKKWAPAAIKTRIDEMLAMVGLSDYRDAYPHQLSGGQQQRVALARALAPNPALLLLDEPLSALDAKVRENLRGEIRQLQKALDLTTIMVTHDQDEAMEMADRIVVLNQGRIEQIGSAKELYHEPKSRFVASFIGRMNFLGEDTAEGSGPLQAIRPEKITLAAKATSTPLGEGQLAGQVEKVIFLGNVTRILVKVAGQSVLIESSDDWAHLESGDEILLQIPAEHLVHLSGADQ